MKSHVQKWLPAIVAGSMMLLSGSASAPARAQVSPPVFFTCDQMSLGIQFANETIKAQALAALQQAQRSPISFTSVNSVAVTETGSDTTCTFEIQIGISYRYKKRNWPGTFFATGTLYNRPLWPVPRTQICITPGINPANLTIPGIGNYRRNVIRRTIGSEINEWLSETSGGVQINGCFSVF